MKRLFTILITLIHLSVFGQEADIQGKVIITGTEAPMIAVQVIVNGNTYLTNEDGVFKVPSVGLPENAMVHISLDDFNPVDLPLSNGMIIKMIPELDEASTIALSLTDLDAGDGDTQSTPGLLFSSGDAYSSIAGYAWGPYWFRQRGYQSNYLNVFIDGVNMANPERGYASWSLWGGLNDVTRNKETTYNLSPVDFSFSNIGGSTNILTDPAQQRPGFKGSYSFSNSSYQNRVMLTYSTGLLDNGWAFTVSGSRRWAQEGYVEGTTYDAWAGFFAVEKQFSKKHKLVFTSFVAPSTRGQQGATVQEVYDLKGTNFYNPYWGYQEGEKRNSREKTTISPSFILKDDWKINDKLRLNTSVGYTLGKGKKTAMNWYDAPDPRPDYYRNLPSYQYDQGNDVAGDMLTELWKSDEFGQVDWEFMYDMNRSNFQTVPTDWLDPDSETVSGNRSHYIIEERHLDSHKLDINPTLTWDINPTWKVHTGLQYQLYQSNNYNTIGDLLGGDYWVDIDNFADRDFIDPVAAVNDLNDDNIVKGEGDRIGHDYDANIQTANWWGQVKKSFAKGSVYLGGNFTNTSMYRFGNRLKGLFPEDSYGKSDVLSFLDYGVKAGGEYFINGRNVITANAAFFTKAPYFQDSFTSLRTRNETVEDLVSSKVTSYDLNYYYRGQRLKFRASAFYTQIADLTDVISYYDDAYQNFVNYVLTGVGQENVGVEVGLQYNITEALRLKGAYTKATYTYNANPYATTTVDNSSEKLSDNETVFYNGRHVGGSPEEAGSLGLEYWSKKYWFIGVQVNYLGDRFVTLNPARYTDRAINEPGIEYGSDEYYAILHQEKMKNTFTVDVSAGKSWKIKDYLFRVNLNVNNILNNSDIQTTGFQQYRFDFVDGNPNKFANKYFYAQGIRAFVNLSLSF
ncbi:TonB-dependent receptor [Flammeovirga agarivorans]|uniref:TonB-dependent receptor n=1 Tax=Flammeovirga agarivorans TaxID=2726742 RepID=A0A7X8XYV9_9BACT|nr:TonB-dependent receptor [Flammeovirga agarivorans]NLR94576.1 TonB-dependent receptor [Flammeovirga agarivorans]